MYTYETASEFEHGEETVSESRAIRECEAHGLVYGEFLADHPEDAYVDGQVDVGTLVRWLGY